MGRRRPADRQPRRAGFVPTMPGMHRLPPARSPRTVALGESSPAPRGRPRRAGGGRRPRGASSRLAGWVAERRKNSQRRPSGRPEAGRCLVVDGRRARRSRAPTLRRAFAAAMPGRTSPTAALGQRGSVPRAIATAAWRHGGPRSSSPARRDGPIAADDEVPAPLVLRAARAATGRTCARRGPGEWSVREPTIASVEDASRPVPDETSRRRPSPAPVRRHGTLAGSPASTEVGVAVICDRPRARHHRTPPRMTHRVASAGLDRRGAIGGLSAA